MSVLVPFEFNHQLLAREDGDGEGPCFFLSLPLRDPDAMEGRPPRYTVYAPLTGVPYRWRIRRCKSRRLFFARQRAHVL